MKKLFVVLTMDCEPIRSAKGATQATSGPITYEESARFIEAFTQRAAARGFPLTFFIHPETAQAHPELFLRWQSAGACLGLHIHPYKIRNTRFRTHFGALSELEQTVLISEASAIWSEALGSRPRYFRPGTFSANDATFPVLTRLGFRGGSISCPGRMYPDLYAIWSGAPNDPHYGNASFRQMPGHLDFVNLPLSVDLSQPEERDGRSFYRDLRPDYQQADYPTIARNLIAQLRARQPAVPTLVVVTHNDNDFSNPDDRVSRNFEEVLNAIATACREEGIEPVGATVESVAQEVRRVIPREQPQFVIGHAALQAG